MLIAASLAGPGCRAHPATHPAWRVRFGPILGNELIVGRIAERGRVWIMTGGNALVAVDLDRGSRTRTMVMPLEGDEHVWGLATTGDGTMWTLVGRTVLAQFTTDGHVVRRVNLAQPHVGIFGAGGQLLYQVMDFQPPAEALTAGPPGASGRRPWSAMKTRTLPLSRTSVAALNLVSCGASETAAVACWFPDQAAVTVTEPSGESRELQLDGLPIVAPEMLLASENPRRPIRDLLIAGDGTLWVLGSGSPPSSAPRGQPGGWLLNQYGRDGRLRRRYQLPEPARLLLRASGDGCVLVGWDGRVVEVKP